MHRETRLDFWLTVITVAALFVPIWGILLEPSHLIRVPDYLLYLGIPAFLFVVVVLVYGRLRNRVLLNRFIVGYAAGFIGSFLVHVFLLAGLLAGLAPDLIGVLGKMMLGRPLDVPVTGSIIAAGVVYHYLLNGAAWGAVYALMFGKTSWWTGLFYGLAIAAVLMISPSFYLIGFQKAGPHFGALILLAIVAVHLIYGGVIGLIVFKFVFPEVGIEGAKAVKPTYA